MIKKVAVIGGGPAGLTTAYNFQKANETGGHTFECIGFEAKSKFGGVWSDTPGESFDDYPTTFAQLSKLKDKEIAGNPRALFYSGSPLASFDGSSISLKRLAGSSNSEPLKLDRKPDLIRNGIFFASKTGLYDNFMSNVPEELMKYDDEALATVQSDTTASTISPLTNLERIKYFLNSFVTKNNLPAKFRMNTSIEYLEKSGTNKWVIVAKRSPPKKNYDEWYVEEFDAVVVANGHFQIPYIPFYMSTPNGQASHDAAIHEYNKKFPGNLVHVRDIDMWYHKILPCLSQESKYRRIVIVGKSFSCMDILKRIIHLKDSMGFEIIISTDIPPMPENKSNPFFWFDEWLVNTSKVIIKPQITKFISDSSDPSIQFADGTLIDGVNNVLFATGYLYSFPFISPKLLDDCKIFVTPDPRNVDNKPSNISRVTGLYLHTFSIAEPTLTFCGISSNANFQSFHISAKAIVGAFSHFNKLFQEQKPTDFPYYDSIWKQILPSINEQLEWSRQRLVKTGNNGAYHFYYPLPLLKEEWLKPCETLFTADQNTTNLFPSNSQSLSIEGIEKLRDLFLEAMA